MDTAAAVLASMVLLGFCQALDRLGSFGMEQHAAFMFASLCYTRPHMDHKPRKHRRWDALLDRSDGAH